MILSRAFKEVLEFHDTFGVPVMPVPTIIPPERRQLRLSLIQEELDELKLASDNGDLVEVADALADILYVVYGTAAEWGIPIDDVFAEVHRSNMTKIWPDGKVHYREDGKVIKPETYSKAEIERVLDSFVGENK